MKNTKSTRVPKSWEEVYARLTGLRIDLSMENQGFVEISVMPGLVPGTHVGKLPLVS